MNEGRRASNSSYDKNVKSLGPVTFLLKGQDLPIKSDNQKVNPVPNKQQYDLSENYSDAKFSVTKSYSKDDIHKVNTSGQCVGLEKMASPVDFDRTVEYWQQDRWTCYFSVKLHIIKDISYHK
ncbi:YTH domain family protein [Trifolium medium]|uniref:YTH domain-containing family protein n=1 Tax=Trifolium medium TaxID=97028 RepID=A0A392MKF3_9FABA|nr:YTH domain family protein [Trifolium medium]